MGIEDETYWDSLLLQNYKHKGFDIYNTVKADLKENRSIYRSILESIGEKDKIIHLSKDQGQLDLLLALDSIDRKIYTYLENPKARAILRNNYLTHQYSKITVVNSEEETFEHSAKVLILNLDSVDPAQVEHKIKDEITILILLKWDSTNILEQSIKLGFSVEIQLDRLTLLKRE